MAKQEDKPILRWTVGPCNGTLGYSTLRESCHKMIELYGNEFRYFICYNNQKRSALKLLNRISDETGVICIEQKSDDMAIQVPAALRNLPNHFPMKNSYCRGSFWKLAPARLDINVHEIIMDNDIVLTRRLPEFEKFLQSENNMLLEDQFRWYGAYSPYIAPANLINSGIIGLHPGYNFEESLNETYYRRDGLQNYTQGDEQGLVVLTLISEPKMPIIIRKQHVVELLGDRGAYEKDAKEMLACLGRLCDYISEDDVFGFHFVQANKLTSHPGWTYYLRMKNQGFSVYRDSFGGSDDKKLLALLEEAYREGWRGSMELMQESIHQIMRKI